MLYGLIKNHKIFNTQKYKTAGAEHDITNAEVIFFRLGNHKTLLIYSAVIQTL